MMFYLDVFAARFSYFAFERFEPRDPSQGWMHHEMVKWWTRHSIEKYLGNVGITIMNHPFGNDLYHPFMVIEGMDYHLSLLYPS